jgi:HK97 family phage prohead protease
MTTATDTRYPHMTLAAFHEVIRSGEQPGDVMLHKAGVIAPVERAPDGDDGSRVRRFAITSERVDRESDTIALDGWSLTEYQRNPVVLWAHDYRSLPVARSARLAVEARADARLMMSDDVFPAEGVYPFADTVLALIDGGFLNATSVGFRPLRWSFNEERFGVDFIEQEMLEHSIVPIPANPDALLQARSAGVDLAPIRLWAEQTLDEMHGERGLWVPRSQVEGAMRVLSSKSVQALIARDDSGGVLSPARESPEAETVDAPEAEAEDAPEAEAPEVEAVTPDAPEAEAEDGDGAGAGDGDETSAETPTARADGGEQEGAEPEEETDDGIDADELRSIVREVARDATREYLAVSSGRLD